MTNHSVGDHDTWEALAAAHALHSLQPDDERRLLDHLDECARCAGSLDGYALVAAQLGSLADAELDEPPAWERLRVNLSSQPRSDVIALDDRRRSRGRASRLLAAAAAVVAVSAGAVATLDLSRGSQTGPAKNVAALAACARQPSCRVVRLHDPDGTNPAAAVVEGNQVSLVPLAMKDAPVGKTYALWQLPRDGGPMLVAEFRDAGRQTASVVLPSAYADTAALAISVESIRATPTRPTDVLAVGTAT